jgi:hypothetical protein
LQTGRYEMLLVFFWGLVGRLYNHYPMVPSSPCGASNSVGILSLIT